MNLTVRRNLSLLLTISSLIIQATISVAKPPNFVITIADDHGVYHSSVYGASEFQTHNLQQMAHDGIRFDNAYLAAGDPIAIRWRHGHVLRGLSVG
ncbi:hypothetical protein [Aporhodopirellula aestuarii]|uniref:Uncharacterized protein n=1 Tax=Aporhodopirellula aestuarii TaxID=2950107 RepID=A0ABT0UCL8_9BACT|nr:hypothetical protein [Aporhodopirellula aestuarii]MCM2374757.1 hypothetical protein [Aporhodopirellula aestuarii]